MNAIVPYQIETIGAGTRRSAGQQRQNRASTRDRSNRDGAARSSPFVVQVIVGGDADLRQRLGKADLAAKREDAYGAALANRPSARPLGFLHLVADA